MKEAERLTDERIELSADEQQKISQMLTAIKSSLDESPEIEITYFVPDEKKAGGKYITGNGSVKMIDERQRMLVMDDGTGVPFAEIICMKGQAFEE